MTGSSYGERDYAFGQLMLTLRTTIGLTQASLGDLPDCLSQLSSEEVIEFIKE